MKLRFSRPILQDAIGNALYAVSSKNTIAAVEGILITCEDGKIIFTSYDLEKGMRIEVEGEIIEPGSVIIPAQNLYSIVKVMPAGMIEIEINEFYRAKVSCGNSEFELNAMNASEYPTLPDISNNKFVYIKQSDLKNMFGQTLFAVAQNDARPTFNGAFFKIEGKKLTTIGCDGFRLAIREKVCELENYCDEEVNASFIVPGRTLSEVIKLLTDADEKVGISFSRKQVIFYFANRNTTFFSRLIEGDYLDYKRIIPQNSSIFVNIDKDIFESALNRASLVSDDAAGKNKSLARCHFYDNKLEITSVSVNGKVRDEIPTLHEGGELEIGFNCRYLTDALRATYCDKLKLSLSSPYISMIIEPLERDENDNFTFLVLPCKL